MFSRTLMGLTAGVAVGIAAPALATTQTIQYGPPYNANLHYSPTLSSIFGSYVVNGYQCNSSSCSAAEVWRKNNSFGEQGLGLTADPEHEIWWSSANDYSFLELNVSGLLDTVDYASFSTNSTTRGEMWLLFGSDTAGDGMNGDLLSYGQDQHTDHAFDSWGTYDYYSLVSFGTLPLGSNPDSVGPHTYGNVLLSSITLTSGVPEPGTWGMMLLGFGAVGFAMRRKGAKNNWIAQAV